MDISRFVQLSLRLCMAALVGWAGVDSQHAQSIAVPVSQLAGAVVLYIIDLFIHSARFADFEKWLASGQFDGAPADPAPSFTANTNGSLTKTATSMLLLFALVPLFFAGCSSPPTERKSIAAVAQSIDTTAQAATELLNSGNLSITTAQSLFEALQTAQAAVEQWNAQRLAGNTDVASKAAQSAVAAANALHDVLLDAQNEAAANASKHATTPTTTPSTAPATQPQ